MRIRILILSIALQFVANVDGQTGKKYVYDSEIEGCFSVRDYFSTIRAVKLETTTKSLIGKHIYKIVSNKEYIVILTKEVLIFDKVGLFINKINRGNGPNELLIPNDVIITDNNEIHVLDTDNKVRIFSIKGKNINTLRLPFRAAYFELLDNGNYIFDTFLDIGTKYYLFQFNPTDSQICGQYIHSLNYGKPGLWRSYPFTKSPNRVHYASLLYDTIYSFNEKGILEKTYLDFGKYQLPQNYYVNLERLITSRPNEVLYRVFKTGKANRIRDLRILEDFVFLTFTTTEHSHHLCSYSYKYKEGIISQSNFFEIHGQMLNNLIGTYYGTSNEEMIFAIHAISFLENINQLFSSQSHQEFSNFNLEYPQFAELQVTLNENDNPIVFFIK